MRTIPSIVIKAFRTWISHDTFLYSAAIAYFTVFSFPALFIFLAKLISLFIDQTRVRAEMTEHLITLLGSEVAQTLNDIIDRSLVHAGNRWTYIFSIIALIFGATRLIVALQGVFDEIWDVHDQKKPWWIQFIYQRFLSLMIVLLIGFVMLISMISTTLLGFIRDWIAPYAPEASIALFQLTKFSMSFTIIGILFTALLKSLPSVYVPWRAAIVGGIISTTLFMLGEYGLNVYFKLTEPHSVYGAAGAVILLMLWVYYVCHILLLGATFSNTVARHARESNS